MASLKLAPLLFAIASAGLAQTAAVSGTVVDAAGDPVRKAVVTLTWQGSPRSWATARSDASGKFHFEGLPAGRYDLRATKAAAGTAIYGAAAARELGELLSLDNGENRADIKLRFIAASSLSGRVVDPDGDPIHTARVVLLRLSRNLGQPVPVVEREGGTNDRGEFRLAGIVPGTYYLQASANQGPSNSPGHSFATQFYGGGADLKNARPIAVHSGESLAGIDFMLTPGTTVDIRGRVTGIPSGEPGARTVQIQLLAAEQAQGAGRFIGIGANADGRFEMRAIPSGRYRIMAMLGGDPKKPSAAEFIDAQPGMNEIVLALTPGVSVKGTLSIEGKSDQKPSAFRVVLNSFPQGVTARVADDGKFSFDPLTPGEWEMNLQPIPRGGYIKSVHLGDKDVRFAKIPIDPGTDAPLNIVISMRAATVQGQIDGPRAGIVLAPVGKFHDLARFYYGGITGPDGKFKLTGIAPGKYKVLAVEKMAPAIFRNPEGADQLGDLGEVIEVSEGDVVTAHPKLIPIERARELLP